MKKLRRKNMLETRASPKRKINKMDEIKSLYIFLSPNSFANDEF